MKNLDILHVLDLDKGISASNICDMLGCSRTDVYRRLRNLVRDGLVADGYRNSILIFGLTPEGVRYYLEHSV